MGQVGRMGHLLFPSLTSSSGLWFAMTLFWPISPSGPILLLMHFNSESAGAAGTFICERQLDLSYGKTGVKHASLLQEETTETSVKPEQSSPERFDVRS